ncbi:MAG: double zinc ribbon domain-containing protein, partial [Thermoplasmata archaeon]
MKPTIEPESRFEDWVYVCMECGAFLRSGEKQCPICGAKISPPESIPKKALERVVESSLVLPSICPKCGAFVKPGEICSVCASLPEREVIQAKVNGLINGVKTKKIVGKDGLINGFVNGKVNGIVEKNGVRKPAMRQGKYRIWKKFVGIVALFAVIGVALFSVFLFVQYPGITIDGKFEDWEGVTI